MDFHDTAVPVRVDLQRATAVGDNPVAPADVPRFLVDRLQRAFGVRIGVEQVGADEPGVPFFVLAFRDKQRVVTVDHEPGGGWAVPQVVRHFTSPLVAFVSNSVREPITRLQRLSSKGEHV